MALRPNGWLAALVLAVAALFAAAGWTAAQRELTSLEPLLLQLLVMAVGLAATAFAGYRSLRAAVEESTRRPARSAFRRVTALYAGYTRIGRSLGRQRQRLADVVGEDGRVLAERAMHSLDLLEAQLGEQSETLQDALDDWRDLAPAEVAEVEETLGKRLEP